MSVFNSMPIDALREYAESAGIDIVIKIDGKVIKKNKATLVKELVELSSTPDEAEDGHLRKLFYSLPENVNKTEGEFQVFRSFIIKED